MRGAGTPEFLTRNRQPAQQEHRNRIRYSKVDAETGDEVESEDIIKGYQVSKGQYIEITDEDLEAVTVADPLNRGTLASMRMERTAPA
jgi:Ku70/Ku80 beta-barrel domain